MEAKQNKPYIDGNKAAWEEAFERRKPGWGDQNAEILRSRAFPFLSPAMIEILQRFDFKDRRIAQFCCNNGRELMSVVKGVRAAQGVGFDIAENILESARKTAAAASIPCLFEQGDVLEIPERYQESFDGILVMIGALCWFERLDDFFAKVSYCLKPGGILLIQEIHPFTDMLAIPGDENYDANEPLKVVYPYFRKEPFVDTFGMNYISGTAYHSKPFTSFSHPLSETLSAILDNQMKLLLIQESEEDVSGDGESIGGKGFPLTYLLAAKKDSQHSAISAYEIRTEG